MTHPALELLRQRVSANHFDPTATLDDATIHTLIDHATQAPSAYNAQNWRFIAVRSAPRKQELMALAYGQNKVGDAAVTFIIVGQLAAHRRLPAAWQPMIDAGRIPADAVAGIVEQANDSYGNDPTFQRDEAVRSGALAAMSLMVAAQALGLVSGPMIGFDPKGVGEAFGLTEEEIPVMLVTVGPPAPGNWPRKTRHPVQDVVSIV
jgi:nitroreductase